MDEKSEQLKASLEHARDLFKYQAGQRHTSLNIYFAVLAAFVAGFVALFAQASVWTGDPPVGRIVGTALGIAAIIVTWLFYLLDRRNQELVQAEWDLLDAIEQDLSICWGIPKLAPGRHSPIRIGGGYRKLVPSMLWVYAVLWILAIHLSWHYPASPPIPSRPPMLPF
jgi:hypothetical protein